MIETIRICDAKEHAGETVRLRGWLRNIRSGKNIFFLIVRDGSGEMQCVAFGGSIQPEAMEQCAKLGIESSLEVTGELRLEPRAPGGVEMQVSAVNALQIVEDYPIAKKDHGVEFLMDNRHLWLRSRKQAAIMRVRNEVEKAWADFFYERGFIRVDTPIFTPNAVEGTTTLFEVDYHGDKAYLSQSGQLYNEANAMALGRVYCFGPTFRAEKSKTRRHLLEFWMLEAEAAYFTHEDNMRLQEHMILDTIRRVLANCAGELVTLERDTTPLANIVEACAKGGCFPRIHYRDAVKFINENMPEREGTFAFGEDFGAPEETFLAGQSDLPVFITNFPAQIKAFYMKRDPKDPETVLGSDLLAPEGVGEIIGGSQREDDLETLRLRVQEHGLPEEAFSWYFDLRKYGSVPHSGFGIGLERTLGWLCGVQHIRETIAFPRMLHHLYP